MRRALPCHASRPRGDDVETSGGGGRRGAQPDATGGSRRGAPREKNAEDTALIWSAIHATSFVSIVIIPLLRLVPLVLVVSHTHLERPSIR